MFRCQMSTAVRGFALGSLSQAGSSLPGSFTQSPACGFHTTPPLHGTGVPVAKRTSSVSKGAKGSKGKTISKKKLRTSPSTKTNTCSAASAPISILGTPACEEPPQTPQQSKGNSRDHEALQHLANSIHKEEWRGPKPAPDLTQILLAEFRNKFKSQLPQHFRLRLAVAEELAGANIVIPTGFKGNRVVLPAIAMRAECHDRRFSETKTSEASRSKKGKKGSNRNAEVSTLSWVYMPADVEKPLLRRVYSGKTMDKVRKTAVSDFQKAVPDVTLLS